MKKNSKVSAPAAAMMSQQELFWDSLYGDDLKLARATGCSCAADLEREKQKKQERQAKADAAQRQNLRENEWKRQKEKEEEKKQREKNREENKWKKQFEIAKKQAFSEGVLEAHDYGDGVYWVQCEDKRWLEVQGEYYCPLCNKQLNQSSLELHINSDAHKKKVAWSLGPSGPGAHSAPSMPAAPRAAVINTAVVKRDAPAAMAEWQTMGPDGLVRCIPCNKVVDDNHISSGDHIRRLESWLAHEQLKKTGYAAPTLEYLAYVPSVAGDDTSERWLKCLLCGKFVQDETSHSGTKENPQGSVQHKKNLTNYVGTAWYQDNVIKERLKWHPAPTVRCKPVPKPAASPAPWAAAPAPASYCGGRAPAAPAANAQPAWMRDDPEAGTQRVYDPWQDEEDTKTTQVPYPSSSETRLPSADAAAEGEGEEFEC